MNPLSEPSNLFYGSVPKAGQTYGHADILHGPEVYVRPAYKLQRLNLTIYFGELDYRSDVTDGT